MPSGGARSRSGPAPDENALRRFRKDDEKTWIALEPGPYTGPVPDNPLHDSDFVETEALGAESLMWRQLWEKPQAKLWFELGLELQVALYVRRYIEAAAPGASAGLTTAVLRMEAELGITPAGMRAHRWRIKTSDDEAPAADQKKDDGKPKKMSARERRKANLALVGGDDDADGE